MPLSPQELIDLAVARRAALVAELEELDRLLARYRAAQEALHGPLACTDRPPSGDGQRGPNDSQ